MASPPPRPRSEQPDDLGFTRKRAVRWLDPPQLASTGLRVAAAMIFGDFADRREVQAALSDTGVHDLRAHRDGDEVWVDYVADTGDGFNATYSVASLLAGDTLSLDGDSGSPERTRRGDVLVMGGDEVYPVASRERYRDRLVGPYRAALPWSQRPHPRLFALPGNHDWYDGLTSFTRRFTQQQWIGGWRLEQDRSYWAVALPHGWWLWGTDIALSGYIDRPQLDYFGAAASQVEEGDRIILFTPKPAWTKADADPDGLKNLRHFENEVVGKTPAKLVAVIAGDSHHYARYAPTGQGPQRFTCGGGGAYQSATHNLAPTLEAEDGVSEYTLERSFPAASVSKRQRWGVVWRLGLRNCWFAGLLGATYLAVVAFAQGATFRSTQDGLLDRLRGHGYLTAWIDLVLVLREAALAGAVLAVMAVGFVLFARPRNRARARVVVKFALGLVHSLAHVALLLALVWASAKIDLSGWLLGIAVVAVVFFGGAVGGGAVVGLYLALCDRLLQIHGNEVFAAQGLDGHKSFLRLRLADDGSATVYAIGLTRVARRWGLSDSSEPSSPWLEPRQPLEYGCIDRVELEAAGASGSS